MLPAEILQKIFSYLSYGETYRMRSICKSWKIQCEYQAYLLMKSRQQKLFIKIGEKGRTSLIAMLPCNYDAENQVIEFRTPADDPPEENDVYMNPNSSRRTQIIFSEWKERSPASFGFSQNLSLADRALVMFHLTYNPSLEQVYQLPPPSSAANEKSHKVQYMGDRGMVMSYSYIYPNKTRQQEEQVAPAIQFRGVEDLVSTSAFDDVFIPTPAPLPLRVHSVFVNFSWLLAGMNLGITTQPLYTSRYAALTELLDRRRIKKHYSPYSESVLEYIMAGEEGEEQEDIESTVILLQNDQEELSKSQQLEIKLQSIGIDPRVIWKYTFAKNFILREQNNFKSDDVARVIQKSEEDWVIKKLELLRSIEN